jgi:hypothetical protein
MTCRPGRRIEGVHYYYPGGQYWPAWQIIIQRLALGATSTTNAAYERAEIVSISGDVEVAL